MDEIIPVRPFGEKLRELLESHQPPISQAQLAKETGIDAGTISRILSRRRDATIDNIVCIAKVLGSDAATLARNTDAEARLAEGQQLVPRAALGAIQKQLHEYEARQAELEGRLRFVHEDLERERERRMQVELHLGDAHLERDRLRSDLEQSRERTRELVGELRSYRAAVERLASELESVTDSARVTRILAAIAAATGVAAIATLWLKHNDKGRTDGEASPEGESSDA